MNLASSGVPGDFDAGGLTGVGQWEDIYWGSLDLLLQISLAYHRIRDFLKFLVYRSDEMKSLKWYSLYFEFLQIC